MGYVKKIILSIFSVNTQRLAPRGMTLLETCARMRAYLYIWQWHSRSRILVFLVVIITMSILLYIQSLSDEEYIILTISNYKKMTHNTSALDGFLVWSPKCRIPDINIYTPEVKKLLKPMKQKSCAKRDPLTYVEVRDNETLLHLDEHMIKVYAPRGNLSCCYSIVTRAINEITPDDKISMTSCFDLKNKVSLNKSVEFIITKCKKKYNGRNKQVYSNGHAMIHRKAEVVERKKVRQNDERRPLSVIIIGIDSISRLNLYRTMPKTAEYLRTRDWIEFRGYNKMGDNTFPNLMAILTGFDNSNSYNVCNPKKLHKLDNCPMIWYKFRQLGYVTAYAEDEGSVSTFNYHKLGFTKPPTDHYFRPYILAMEKELNMEIVSDMHYCLGPVSAGERIMNYAYDFVKAYENDTYFGFFWMNSFSHSDINTPTSMDTKVRQFFNKLETTNIFNKSMVIFLSDHGVRFGKIRGTISGWLEERLPFIHFWLPKWFTDTYPQTLKNLKVNSGRLTSPYDLHMTLQDVLVKSDLLKSPVSTEACPECRSLFEEANWNRSCKEAGITDHWCTCGHFQTTAITDPVVIASAKSIVDKINNMITVPNNKSNICAKLKLNKIIDSRVSPVTNSEETLYLVLLETIPGLGRFEATVGYRASNNSLDVKDAISRINKYANQSRCVQNDYLKKVCYCK